MTVEEARQVQAGDRVRVTAGNCSGMVGYVPWVDRISDQEPHAVVLPTTSKGCHHLIKIECLERVGC